MKQAPSAVRSDSGVFGPTSFHRQPCETCQDDNMLFRNGACTRCGVGVAVSKWSVPKGGRPSRAVIAGRLKGEA